MSLSISYHMQFLYNNYISISYVFLRVSAKEDALSKDDKTNSRPGKYICRPAFKNLRFEVFFLTCFDRKLYILYLSVWALLREFLTCLSLFNLVPQWGKLTWRWNKLCFPKTPRWHNLSRHHRLSGRHIPTEDRFPSLQIFSDSNKE